ncbi:Uncharacterized protein HZ326_17921 [Fusarium oxysporum f. sp. albedinis]|nr:Uncharacterized protein HZ326_17921 [Fusarium oxysporum f. sp. albedinis]
MHNQCSRSPLENVLSLVQGNRADSIHASRDAYPELTCRMLLSSSLVSQFFKASPFSVKGQITSEIIEITRRIISNSSAALAKPENRMMSCISWPVQDLTLFASCNSFHIRFQHCIPHRAVISSASLRSATGVG